MAKNTSGVTVLVEDNGTTKGVLKTVVFLTPWHRYCRGDIAGFSEEYAGSLVARHIAAWPEGAQAALDGKTWDKQDDQDALAIG
ncbi:hypothetical protein E0G79_26080 [Salmonella enterica]|nr:hypothetical protein [Salmonella enterica]EBA9765545.1 hypothetical protein [Salmonella enterica]EEB5699298.1 hypothetical protein [Salmonella enterica]EGX5144518.1 hypothetical protein [Salmonella enterica]ELF4900209.1 hypothetical protein [Salmonella enterica]